MMGLRLLLCTSFLLAWFPMAGLGRDADRSGETADSSEHTARPPSSLSDLIRGWTAPLTRGAGSAAHRAARRLADPHAMDVPEVLVPFHAPAGPVAQGIIRLIRSAWLDPFTTRLERITYRAARDLASPNIGQSPLPAPDLLELMPNIPEHWPAGLVPGPAQGPARTGQAPGRPDSLEFLRAPAGAPAPSPEPPTGPSPRLAPARFSGPTPVTPGRFQPLRQDR